MTKPSKHNKQTDVFAPPEGDLGLAAEPGNTASTPRDSKSPPASSPGAEPASIFPLIDQPLAPEIKLGIADDAYHADKRFVSSSGVKQAMRSAASWRAFLERKNEPTDAMKFGTLAHLAILEPERFKKQVVTLPDFGNMRTNAAKEARAEYLAQLPPGCIFGTAEEMSDLNGMVEAILAHEDAVMILKRCTPEVSGYYVDKATGLWCKVRADILDLERTEFLFDLKTTKNSRRERFASDIWDFKYNVQLYMYAHGVKAITGKMPEHCGFIAVEKTAPFEVEVFLADENMMRRGREGYELGMRTIEKAVRTRSFPRRSAGMVEIALPGYTDFQ